MKIETETKIMGAIVLGLWEIYFALLPWIIYYKLIN